MKTRNCPTCRGNGRLGRAGRCLFCHGKKKITSKFVKWYTKRSKKEAKIRQEMLDAINRRVKISMYHWEEKSPKPRNFLM